METPNLLEVKKLSPTQILFRWGEGHDQIYSVAHLRRNCHCAYCVNELTGQRMLDPKSVPEELTVDKISLVGRYALSFKFGDSHETGIYPYELLYKICPCSQHAGKIY